MRFDPKFENERIFPDLGKDCLAKTRPIFASCGPSDLEALGSCFFIKYLNRFFLVTAAHVGTKKAELFTRVHGRPGPLAPDKIDGTFHFIGHRGEAPGTDRTDVGFMEMDASRASLAAGSYFDASSWDENDQPSPDAVYLACGWPGKLNDPIQMFPGEPQSQEHVAFFNRSLSPDQYAQYGIDPSSHYAVEHDIRQLNQAGELVTPPELPGMSGSPLVFVHRYGSESDLMQVRTPKLVGVVIEHHERSHFIVATRLKILLAGIRAYLERPGDSAEFLA